MGNIHRSIGSQVINNGLYFHEMLQKWASKILTESLPGVWHLFEIKIMDSINRKIDSLSFHSKKDITEIFERYK